MNGKTRKHHFIGFGASLAATGLLVLIEKVWGMEFAELVGFGLLIGFSYATLFKS
jgi:hypothetical protein